LVWSTIWRSGRRILLYIETLIIRIILGGQGVIPSIITTTLLFTLILSLRSYYFKIRQFNKIVLSLSINLLFSILFLLFGSLTMNTFFDWHVWTNYIVTNLFGILLVCFSLEAIRKNYLVRMKLFQSSRIETVGHLSAAFNHEIKNPLTTVRGMIQLLKSDPALPYEQREIYYNYAIDEIDKMDRIVTDYLTYARPYEDSMEKLQINLLIKEAIENLQETAEKLNINIVIGNLDEKVIIGYKSKMVQVFTGIIQNSIDALPNGGTINITTQIIKQHYHIYFKDNGVGMSKDVLDRMGEPIFLMNSSGTGLSMMLAYKIIERMKGTISIMSKLGMGTEVKITLPILTNIEKA
jgi:two-component system, sporulation sensor kinase B